MPPNGSAEVAKKGYETSDVSFRPWAWFVAVFIVTMVVIYHAVLGFMQILAGPNKVLGRTEHPADQSLSQFPQPRLQTDPASDLKSYLKQKETELTTYGWIDRKAGIVRIPIDQAMNTFVSRGFPVRPADSGLTELDIQIQKAGGAKILPPAASQRQSP
ncbi:MAG: hypothetical protein WBZ19_27505 [Chthoniobacterales bacterium]